jgi:hypothetical protein
MLALAKGFCGFIGLHLDHFFCTGSDSDIKLTTNTSFYFTVFVNFLIPVSNQHNFLFSPFLESQRTILFHTDFYCTVYAHF